MNASTSSFFYPQSFIIMILLLLCQDSRSNALLDKSEESATPCVTFSAPPKNARSRKGAVNKKPKKNRHYVADMTREELHEAQKQAIEKGNLEFAIKCTEQNIKLCTNSYELPDLMICLANLYFDTGNFETAVRLYSEFTAMYPGRKDLEFASYRAILAQFYLTSDADRDQTNTHIALTMAEQFLARSTIFNHYQNEVAAIATQCYQKEAESEVRICSFYINQGNIKAAQNRLMGLRENFLTHLPTLEPQIISLECTLAAKQKPMAAAPKETLTLTPETDKPAHQVTQKSSAATMKNRF